MKSNKNPAAVYSLYLVAPLLICSWLVVHVLHVCFSQHQPAQPRQRSESQCKSNIIAERLYMLLVLRVLCKLLFDSREHYFTQHNLTIILFEARQQQRSGTIYTVVPALIQCYRYACNFHLKVSR